MRMTCVAAFDRVEAALSTTRFDAAFAAFEAGLQSSRFVAVVESGGVVEGGVVDAEVDRLDVAEVDKAVAAAVDGTA